MIWPPTPDGSTEGPHSAAYHQQVWRPRHHRGVTLARRWRPLILVDEHGLDRLAVTPGLISKSMARTAEEIPDAIEESDGRGPS